MASVERTIERAMLRQKPWLRKMLLPNAKRIKGYRQSDLNGFICFECLKKTPGQGIKKRISRPLPVTAGVAGDVKHEG